MRAKDSFFALIAHQMAVKSGMKQKLGTVITCGKKIIGKGFNRYTGVEGKWSIHAEIEAISHVLNFSTDKGLTLYVVRSRYRNSKPCPTCMNHIKNSAIKRVVYSDQGSLKEILL